MLGAMGSANDVSPHERASVSVLRCPAVPSEGHSLSRRAVSADPLCPGAPSSAFPLWLRVTLLLSLSPEGEE